MCTLEGLPRFLKIKIDIITVIIVVLFSEDKTLYWCNPRIISLVACVQNYILGCLTNVLADFPRPKG